MRSSQLLLALAVKSFFYQQSLQSLYIMLNSQQYLAKEDPYEIINTSHKWQKAVNVREGALLGVGNPNVSSTYFL